MIAATWPAAAGFGGATYTESPNPKILNLIAAAGFGASAFMKPLLQNLCLSLGNNEEICYCLKNWNELPSSVRNGGRPSKEEALQAVAVVGRIRRAISEVSVLAWEILNHKDLTAQYQCIVDALAYNIVIRLCHNCIRC